ncbi:hypothetical protein SARC_15042 [Sphaeroforma arctica JP610]|uniref:Uncharacterized protein n=1 Tax=Sphaeroforma arctica JP610 TaxID=667725 RepID=A0A0L0F8G3_9EUKA|nr:hypothetical protein SARC_15042 [Sphaeroforma arctica JP610]KNC72398.1 hypothetical protein SARC_15042 [Sphaeroforma arctica JP610]|eukprot:XP_014146300.1 hypothetical protein SARC_15042 [Sphaeroforma arctica JP610]
MAKDIEEYGPQLKLIQNRAITFHCGSPRIFCGTLITGTAPKKDEKEEENEKEIYDLSENYYMCRGHEVEYEGKCGNGYMWDMPCCRNTGKCGDYAQHKCQSSHCCS